MKKLTLLLIACCALVVSCSKDGGGKNNQGKTYAEVKTLDIANAEYLYSTQSENSARSRADSDNPAQLFKVLSNGATEEIAIIDANGETIPVEEIMVNSATDDLIFFGYTYKIFDYNDGHGYDWYNHFAPAYFTRTSDGAVFELPEMFHQAFGWSINGFSEDLVGYGKLYKDKYQNLYCSASADGNYWQNKGIYKIESQSGIKATSLIDNFGTLDSDDFCVDHLGNIVYINTLGDIWCLTATGQKFLCEESIWFPNFAPLPNSEDGGFLYLHQVNSWEVPPGTPTRSLRYYKVNERNQEFDITTLDLSEEEVGTPIALSDKAIIVGDGARTIIVIKSLTDIRKIDMSGGLGNVFEITKGKNLTDNYLYWYNDGAIYSLDLNTGNKETIHQLNQSRYNSNFSFADDMVIYYSTDKQGEKIYLCKVKSGVYSETDLSEAGVNSTPQIIDFIRCN